MKQAKRITAFLLTCVLLLSVLPAQVFAAPYPKSKMDAIVKEWNKTSYSEDQNKEYYGASGCAAFSRYVFYQLYGHTDKPSNGNNTSKTFTCKTPVQLLSYLSAYAAPGDAFRLTVASNTKKTHIMNLYDITEENKIKVYQSNYEDADEKTNKAEPRTFASAARMVKSIFKIEVNGGGNFTSEITLQIIHAKDNPKTSADFSGGSVTYTLHCQNNYSGKNYLWGTDFIYPLEENPDRVYSRNESVAKLYIDKETQHNGYNSLKIVNTSAGTSDGNKDLTIYTLTNSRGDKGWVADSKSMTMSFWAKATNENTKLYFRWGFQDGAQSVTLTKDWAFYTLPLNKTVDYDTDLHPWVDRAGTVWISEMQLEDGTEATAFVPENYTIYYERLTQTGGQKYELPADPVREGYTFAGWFTAKSGGEQITAQTAVKDGDLTVYAHWTPNAEPTEPTTAPTEPTTKPTEPTTKPTEPTTKPTEATEPTTKPTEPAKPCDGGASCPSKAFTDVNYGDWYHEAVDFAVTKGLFNGMSPSSFAPNTPMSRAMLVTVLWRYAGSPKEGTNTFADVPNGQWYTDAIAWAAKNGIVTGIGNNKFDPNGNITRVQMAAILYRYSGDDYNDYDQFSERADLTVFPDWNIVSAWGKDAFGWAVSKKLINGNDGRLDPLGNATRAQVATILMRFIRNGAESQAQYDTKGHTYGVALGMYSWEDAQKAAKANGGYLVRFDSEDEFKYVTGLLSKNGYENAILVFGARRAESSKDYYFVDKDGNAVGSKINTASSWTAAYWGSGEPTFEWDGKQEPILALEYKQNLGKWTINDIVDNLAYPADPNCHGFIVEYDNTPAGTCAHEWQAATCFAPKTCSKCGATEGTKLGHKMETYHCPLCGHQIVMGKAAFYSLSQEYGPGGGCAIFFYEDNTYAAAAGGDAVYVVNGTIPEVYNFESGVDAKFICRGTWELKGSVISCAEEGGYKLDIPLTRFEER